MAKRQLKRALTTTATALAAGAGIIGLPALAGITPAPNDFAKYADPEGVVLAVAAEFDAVGGAVRVLVYDNEAAFLEEAAAKTEALVNEEGVAVAKLGAITPGDYAFVAYLDQNRDGKLNRGGVLGKPKEPYAFSNGVKPKLRKPRFEETKVDVTPGAVVVLTLED